MGCVAWGNAKPERVLAVIAATAVTFFCGSTAAQASRTVSPASLDFGVIKNWPAGGRAGATLTYSVSADETFRYAWTRADGGALDGSTQFSIGGGNCYTAFPTPTGAPASCSILIHFDYARSARGISSGALVIDGDARFDTTADQTIVPLSAYVIGLKKKCRKKRRGGSAEFAKRKCKKKR
jgi:hypothetical protein